MSIADLDVILELLQNQVTICHYLRRRGSFERDAAYFADEYDLIAFYLKTGFNIGDTEFDGTYLGIYGMSSQLDAYFMRSSRDRGIKRPEPRRTQLWKDILAGLEARQPQNWLEIGYRLLNIGYDQQAVIERELPKLGRQIAKSRKMQDSMAGELANGPQQRREAAVFCVYKCRSREERNHRLYRHAQSTMQTAGTNDCLIVGVDTLLPPAPYHVIGIMRREA